MALATACLALVCACAPVTPPLRTTDPTAVLPGAGPETFSVLTYNVWHGLDTGEFWVTPSETPEQSDARLQFLIAQISAARPDLILLQEVNPLPAQADRYVQALADRGLDYDAVHQVDACGVRLHGDTALIPGLNNGLVILARQTLQLRKLVGLKLSGDLGQCESTSGVQFEELRYALIADITIPEAGQHYVIASTHLHSGFEAGAAFLAQLERMHQGGQSPRYRNFRWGIEQSRLRRIGELDTLAREFRKLLRHGDYAGFAVGGDFNFESDFPEYQEAMLLRLEDTHSLATRDQTLETADPQRNGLIHNEREPALPASLQRIIEALPPAQAEEVPEAYRLETGRPRRIDYLFVQGFLPGYCLKQHLFGTDHDSDGRPASDHYGILTTFRRTDGPCPGT
jgi:endonuclease/exonuclease/phosphatase family metal-dependent hydrolase